MPRRGVAAGDIRRSYATSDMAAPKIDEINPNT